MTKEERLMKSSIYIYDTDMWGEKLVKYTDLTDVISEIYDHFEPIEAIAKQNIKDSFNGISCSNCKHLEYIEKSYKQCTELYINIGHISQDEFYCAYWESNNDR